MADKSDESKSTIADEVGKALALADSDEGAPVIDDATALSDIDQMLAEEDPEFLNQIAEIRVEASSGSLSIIDDVITNLNRTKKTPIKWHFHFQNLLSIKDEPKKFILFWGLVGICLIVIFFGSKITDLYYTNGLFLRSYAEWNSDVRSFNPLTEAEPFYDNPRFARNLVTLTKMYTNVKASEGSSENPMLALELSVEGMSAEAIIEIKDREAEFKDILLRQAEEFSYDELTTGEGKKALMQKFTIAINANLTQGQVRRSMLRSFILKP